MSATRELIQRLPDTVVKQIEVLGKKYKNSTVSLEEARSELYGYTNGLRDAGLITERDRKILFIYGTVCGTIKEKEEKK